MLGKVGNVEFRPEQPIFFRTPPDESDLEVGVVFSNRIEDFEDESGAGSVIVYTGPRLDAVQVSTDLIHPLY